MSTLWEKEEFSDVCSVQQVSEKAQEVVEKKLLVLKHQVDSTGKVGKQS